MTHVNGNPLGPPEGKENKVGGLLTAASASFSWVAIAALFLMLVVVAVDILSSKIFNRPVTAAVDVASVAAICVIAFALPQTVLAGRHIEVEFVVARLPKRLRQACNAFSSLLSLGFFALLAWRLYVYAQELSASNEVTLTQHIPLAPLAYAVAIVCVPAAAMYARQFWQDVRKGR